MCFKHLKYLEWLGFPFSCMDNFEMGNVVDIKLFHSKLEILWEGAFKSLKKLRILHVSSSYLIRTGSFIGLENLEKLYLNGCVNLEELDTSIGCLQKLVILNLSECKQLKRVPWEMIGKLTSLVKLNLNECHNVLNISHQLGNLKSLQELYLERNSFRSLPDSLCQLHQLSEIRLSGCDNLKSMPSLPPNIEEVYARDSWSLESLPSNMSELQFLTELVLDNCKKLGSQGLVKVTGLRNLFYLSMKNCNVSQVCSEIGNMVSLVDLRLSGNTFTSLPDSISNLSQLKWLEIYDCHKLKLLPLLPSNLRDIEASGCRWLQVMPYDTSQKGYMFRSQWCRHLLVNTQQHHPSELAICLHEEEDATPEWCSYTSIGEEELCFVAPPFITTTQQSDNKKICGVIFYGRADSDSSITMLNKTKGTSHEFFIGREFDAPSMCVTIYPLNDETFVVESGDTLVIQYHDSIGLSFIYEDDVVDDSAFVLKKDINAIEQFNTLTTTGINDEVWILPTPDNNECIYYNFFPDVC